MSFRRFVIVIVVGVAGLAAAPAHAGLKISAPTLAPEFRPQTRSYVVECEQRVPLKVRSGRRWSARIGARRFFSGTSTRNLRMEEGQAVKVTRRHRGKGKRRTRYFVRCLPGNFPAYKYTPVGKGRSGPFAITPFAFADDSPNYAIVFDEWGAPIWWFQGETRLVDAKALSNGTLAFARYYSGEFSTDPDSAYELRRPNGSLHSVLRTVGAITDLHDLQETADGNYLLLAYAGRANPVDAYDFNEDSSAEVLDAVVQKLTPDGELLWEWNSKDHIDLAETDRWWEQLSEPYDIVHINAVEPTISGDDYLISMRHTDAIYRIDGESGEVEWKLGGTETAESLRMRGDPSGDYPLGGQHDVRQLPDGTITVYDNATDLDRPPRGVRYRVIPGDPRGRARLVDMQRDSRRDESICCGSGRWLGDSWLFSWGGNRVVTELDSNGVRTFQLRMSGPSYRATPIEGMISKRALRRGMDRQVPLKK